MTKNIVILSDGTGNEPRLRGDTNVLRLYDLLDQDAGQEVWYEPGVGTNGSPKALTPATRAATRIAGLGVGYGLKDNVAGAYQFLMRKYEPGDRIYLLGFSRGAYTVRAVAGLLFQIGLLRPDLDHLLPYALRLFWWHESNKVSPDTWKEVEKFSGQFSRPDFPRLSERQIHHVGVWDTVNATGILRGRLVLPWTAAMPMTQTMSHAVSIDERRRPFRPSLLKPDTPGLESGDFKEVWFAGVHSDVGGTFDPDHRLADITMGWILGEAVDRGLRVNADGAAAFSNLAASDATGTIHKMGKAWAVTMLGFHRTITPDNARVHQSVKVRMDQTAGDRHPYRPPLPRHVRWEPWPHAPT